MANPSLHLQFVLQAKHSVTTTRAKGPDPLQKDYFSNGRLDFYWKNIMKLIPHPEDVIELGEPAGCSYSAHPGWDCFSPIPNSKWFQGIPDNLCSPYVLSSKWVVAVILGVFLDTHTYILWLYFCHILKTSKGYQPEPVVCKCQPHPHMVQWASISKNLKTKSVGYCHYIWYGVLPVPKYRGR